MRRWPPIHDQNNKSRMRAKRQSRGNTRDRWRPKVIKQLNVRSPGRSKSAWPNQWRASSCHAALASHTLALLHRHHISDSTSGVRYEGTNHYKQRNWWLERDLNEISTRPERDLSSTRTRPERGLSVATPILCSALVAVLITPSCLPCTAHSQSQIIRSCKLHGHSDTLQSSTHCT